MPHRRARAAIFDFDGLLLDTEPMYALATRTVVDRHGRTLDQAVWLSLIGRPSPEVARGIVEAHHLDTSVEEFEERRLEILRTLLPDAQPQPGAVELTTRLAAAEVPIAIGTSSSRETFELKTASHGEWIDRFDHVVLADEVTHGKPAPDIFLRAAELLGVPATQSVVFEDAVSGVRAAQAAGAGVVMVPTEGADLSGIDPPDEVLGSLLDFDPVAWGLLEA